MIREYEVKTQGGGSGGQAKGLMIVDEYASGEGEHKPGGVTWCTDGQGNSWSHFPEETFFDKIPKWVIFLMGFQVGAFIPAVAWYVW